jgi:hypothetical protein
MALFGRDYGRDYGYSGDPRYGRERKFGAGWGPYDGEYGYGFGDVAGYDRAFRYKSRWQTDYGDPFGDRVSRTPMRMIRGDFRRGYGAYHRGPYDVGIWGGERDRGDWYFEHPMGYEPHEGPREPRDRGLPDRTGRRPRGGPGYDEHGGGPWRGYGRYGEDRYDFF